jgi:hypothetical protein
MFQQIVLHEIVSRLRVAESALHGPVGPTGLEVRCVEVTE